jgi:hypothetical protein
MKTLEVQHGGDHYRSMAIQPAEYNQKNKLGFSEGCVIKYTTRHRQKGGAVDLQKAIHFLTMILEDEYKVVSTVDYYNATPTASGIDVGDTPYTESRKGSEDDDKIQMRPQWITVREKKEGEWGKYTVLWSSSPEIYKEDSTYIMGRNNSEERCLQDAMHRADQLNTAGTMPRVKDTK